MSENGEIYTAGKNFTLPPALTALTNSTSALSQEGQLGPPVSDKKWFFSLKKVSWSPRKVDSTAVSIFVVTLVELTNCQFNQYHYKYWDGSAVYRKVTKKWSLFQEGQMKNEQFLKLCLYDCVSHIVYLETVKVVFWKSIQCGALTEILRKSPNEPAQTALRPNEPISFLNTGAITPLGAAPSGFAQQCPRCENSSSKVWHYNFVTSGGDRPRNEETVVPPYPVM